MPRFYLKKTYLLLVLLIVSISLQASYLRNVPQKLVQPNGEIVYCYATGDEFYHWLHDEEGYTIVQNPQTGYFCYAIIKNSELISSPYVVGKVSPATVGLSPRINISPKKMTEIREQFRGLEKKYRDQSKEKSIGPQKVNTTGVLNNVVIYIRFSGEAEYTTSQSVYTEKFNSSASGVLSQHNYFNEVSYGTLNMNSNFLPTNNGTQIISYQDSHTRNYFLKYDATTNTNGYDPSIPNNNYTDPKGRVYREHTLLQAAVNSVANQLSSGINIDNDGDGYVDNVCFIVQGSPAGWSDLLWPHKWSLYSLVADINGKQVGVYNFQLENSLDVSVLCHEMFHTLGAPDLYHYTDGTPNPVGEWDLMNTDNAQHMTQYMKYRYGKWIASIPEITNSGDYTLNPVFTKDNSCYKVKSPFSSTEYFVIEYRKKEKLDAVLPAEGLLVYRINSLEDGLGNSSGPPDELYVYRPGGSTTNEGTLASAPFSANKNNTSFNDKTNPDPFLSSGNIGGLSISNISSIGATISFHVDILSPLNVDAAATKFLTPVNGFSLSSAEKIKVNISNFGTSTISSGLKVNYKVNGSSTVSEDFTGTLASGETAPFEFSTTVDLSSTGDYNIKVYTTLAGDLNTANDTIISTISNSLPLEYIAPLATTTTGTYTELTSGTTISVDLPKDGLSTPVTFPDGFIFIFSKIPFTKFMLSTNGFIKLGDQNPSSKSLCFTGPQIADGGVFNSNNSADNAIIAPFNHDLTPGSGGAEYKMDISGTVPNRVVTIQFKNVRDNDAVQANQYNSMNFQIKLYEGSNIIEFVYGLWTPSTNASAFKTSLCGIRGLGNSPAQLLAVNKGSTIGWGQVSFSNANYNSTATLNFGNTNGNSRPAPEVGRIMRFTPRQANDLAVQEIYTMGQLPLNYATPHKISAAIINYGTTTQTGVNVTLHITGDNEFSPPIVIIPSIEPFDTLLVEFENFYPSVIGTNTVSVSLPDDNFAPNNLKSLEQTTTSNRFSYATQTSIAANAYKDRYARYAYVCKYHVNGSIEISSVETMILNNSTEMIGKSTRAYVYNSAGAKIGQSNNFTVSTTNLGKWVTMAITTPPAVANSDFYVGLDCTSGYFGAYITEAPTRKNTYFMIPLAGGTPVEFGQDAAFLFRAIVSPVTGIDPNNGNAIKIYSNSQTIFVEIPLLKGAAKILVYNIIGNQVYSKTNPIQGLTKIDENFNAGTYIVKVIVGQEVKTQKVVLNK